MIRENLLGESHHEEARPARHISNDTSNNGNNNNREGREREREVRQCLSTRQPRALFGGLKFTILSSLRRLTMVEIRASRRRESSTREESFDGKNRGCLARRLADRSRVARDRAVSTTDEHRRFTPDRWRTEIHFTANTIQ